MIRTEELFEGQMGLVRGMSVAELRRCKELYEYLVSAFEKSGFINESADKVLSEGVLSGLLVGVGSVALQAVIGKAVCKALGVDPNGTLGKLITSPLVAGTIGYEIGR